MSKKKFQILVWISLVWIAIAVGAAFLARSDLNPILLDQLDKQLDTEWTLFDSLGAAVVLVGLVCNIALLFYKRWARFGYLILIPVSVIITLFDGPVISSSTEEFTNNVDVFISGVLWALLMFTDIKFEFGAYGKSSQQDALTAGSSG